MSTDPERSRWELGARLRQIRKLNGLTGRALAVAIGAHFTTISKIENGHNLPTVSQIQAWCVACRVPEQQDDLLSTLLSVEEAYSQWRTRVRAGMRNSGGPSGNSLYDTTTVYRIFELAMIPGIFQIPAYIAAIVKYWRNFYDIPDDTEEVIRLRQRRSQQALRPSNRLVVVLAEAAVKTRFTSTEDHEVQLLDLLKVMKKPNVSLGIIPSSIAVHPTAQVGFWIYDSSTVLIELPSAEVKVTRPSEIETYLRVFEDLQSHAVYGAEAKNLLMDAIRPLE